MNRRNRIAFAASHGTSTKAVSTTIFTSGPRRQLIGIAIGLSLHTLIDGVALAASGHCRCGSWKVAAFAGLARSLLSRCTSPLDSLSITTLMTRKAGLPDRDKRSTSPMSPWSLGAGLFALG